MDRTGRDADAERIILLMAALTAGFAFGMLYTSPRGRKTRMRVADEASRGVKWIDQRLDRARERILAAGDEAAEHLRSVVEETVDKVIPDLGSEDDWDDVYADIDEELRRLKQ